MQIRTISNLQIAETWEGIKLHEIAIRQGSLDGACGPYALMAMLMIQLNLKLKAVEQLWDGGTDKRTLFGKWLMENSAMLGDGTTIQDLSSLLNALKRNPFRKKLSELHLECVFDNSSSSVANKKCITGIADLLEKWDRPLLLQLDWDKSSAHWVIAVGYQVSRFNESGGKPIEIASILTLDSASDTSHIAAWNGVLSEGALNAKKLRYLTYSEPSAVSCRVAHAYLLKGLCE